MKSSHILAASIAALCVTHSASASVTVRYAGSTAFRAAVTTAMQNVLNNPAISYAGGGSFTGATYVTFVGTLSGVSGTVTVKCSWGGSVDGIHDVANATNEIYLANGVASSTGSGTSVAVPTTVTGELAAPDVAMADNTQASTPFTTPVLSGNSAPFVGIVPFAFVKSRSAPADLTNLTRQQFNWLYSNAFIPAYQFSGNVSDTMPIWAFGRNPFSGTRLNALSETGYGSTTAVIQHEITPGTATGSGITLAATQIEQYPDVASVDGISESGGNNGESSGGSLAGYMRYLSTSVTDDYGLFSNAPEAWIAYLGEADSLNACWGLSSTIGYNANSTGTDRAQYISYEGVAGFQGEGKNAVAGTITGGNTLTISSVGPAADALHQGATPGTQGLVVGQAVEGTGITPGSTIASIVNATTITLDLAQTNGSVSGVIFSSLMPNLVRNGQYPYWNYENMLWLPGTPSGSNNIVGSSGDKYNTAVAIRNNVVSTTYVLTGISISSMKVQRSTDGGPISPISYP